jgi:hypothetical protein
MRPLETTTRLVGYVLITSTWYLDSQCCSCYDSEGAERGHTGCSQVVLSYDYCRVRNSAGTFPPLSNWKI